ncbi:FecR protein [compost metagenome]
MSDQQPRISPEDLDAPLDPCLEKALAWIVQLHSGTQTSDDWAAFERWKSADETHRLAARQAERIWSGLAMSDASPRKPASRRLQVAAVGALGLALLLGGYGRQDGWFADYRTAVAERRVVELADGTRMELAPSTRVDVRLSAGEREVRLYGGELHVQVAADRDRPFYVRAGEGSIRALGTGFDVLSENDRVRVAVTEHAVEVRYRDGTTESVTEVGEGQAFDYGRRRTGQRAAESVEVADLTAWRRGRLVFDARPLGEVIDELNHYRKGLLVITDASLRELPVTGVFDISALERQLPLLESALPVRLVRWPGVTLIERDDTRNDPATR